jgi:serine/threonine protein kinase
MEYLKGGDLLTAVSQQDHYHESDARKIMLQIASALKYLQSKKVVHRDIKPMNLILANRSLDSPVKLVDFGFATIETEELQRPSNYLCGTPGYMAPEVISQRSYSCKVDIWGLGVVFYIMLSGCMPFAGDKEGETMIKVSGKM